MTDEHAGNLVKPNQMKKNRKEFDAVRSMREIRDRLSKEVEGMTFEEEKPFIQKQGAHLESRRPRQRTMTRKKNSAESSVEEIYGIIKGHLTSLPEDQALARIEIIDQAHAKAQAQARARRPRTRLKRRARAI